MLLRFHPSINRKGVDKFMNLSKRKKQLSTFATTLSLLAIKSTMCFATQGTIGTAEVETATENIQRVIISIAMPLGRCLNFCKYCYSCNKNDCKCK